VCLPRVEDHYRHHVTLPRKRNGIARLQPRHLPRPRRPRQPHLFLSRLRFPRPHALRLTLDAQHKSYLAHGTSLTWRTAHVLLGARHKPCLAHGTSLT
jgi:hypothetical protein